jgi:RecA-family ATPase
MVDYWNDRCHPPWDLDQLRTKVDNAYKYAKGEAGAASAEVQFDALNKPKTHLHFELYDEIKDDFKYRALVKGLIDEACLSVMYGDSNSGKTFVALDIGLKVAAGSMVHNRKVKQGGVVYVAAEGGGTLRKRVMGFRKQHDFGSIPFGIIPCPVNLLNPNADTAPLIDLIKNFQTKTRVKTEMVVVDTLARALAGGNENASDDMGAFVRSVDRIRSACDCHVMVIHHTGKDKARGARGHSSLRAATDTEIEVLPGGELRITKQRDMEMGKPIGFRLEQVDTGS